MVVYEKKDDMLLSLRAVAGIPDEAIRKKRISQILLSASFEWLLDDDSKGEVVHFCIENDMSDFLGRYFPDVYKIAQSFHLEKVKRTFFDEEKERWYGLSEMTLFQDKNVAKTLEELLSPEFMRMRQTDSHERLWLNCVDRYQLEEEEEELWAYLAQAFPQLFNEMHRFSELKYAKLTSFRILFLCYVVTLAQTGFLDSPELPKPKFYQKAVVEADWPAAKKRRARNLENVFGFHENNVFLHVLKEEEETISFLKLWTQMKEIKTLRESAVVIPYCRHFTGDTFQKEIALYWPKNLPFCTHKNNKDFVTECLAFNWNNPYQDPAYVYEFMKSTMGDSKVRFTLEELQTIFFNAKEEVLKEKLGDWLV